jgi:hypothetical protein
VKEKRKARNKKYSNLASQVARQVEREKEKPALKNIRTCLARWLARVKERKGHNKIYSNLALLPGCVREQQKANKAIYQLGDGCPEDTLSHLRNRCGPLQPTTFDRSPDDDDGLGLLPSLAAGGASREPAIVASLRFVRVVGGGGVGAGRSGFSDVRTGRRGSSVGLDSRTGWMDVARQSIEPTGDALSSRTDLAGRRHRRRATFPLGEDGAGRLRARKPPSGRQGCRVAVDVLDRRADWIS